MSVQFSLKTSSPRPTNLALAPSPLGGAAPELVHAEFRDHPLPVFILISSCLVQRLRFAVARLLT